MTDQTAILITAFNRPALLRSLLESLADCELPIYLSVDLAKDGDPGNQQLVAECLRVASDFTQIIAELRLPEVSQGCFLGVSRAISWGFSKASRLIILEDDILPGKTFLAFASQMLIEFQEINWVGSIGGTNLVPDSFITDPSLPYRFSAYTTSWGWATWSDRWTDYEKDLDTFPQLDFRNPKEFWSHSKRHFWEKILRATADGTIDTWDYRWIRSNWKHGRLAIIPNANLVLNMGFGDDATHTRDSPWWLPTEISTHFKVEIQPLSPTRDILADEWMESNHFRSTLGLQLRHAVSSSFPRIAVAYRKYLKR